MTEEELEKKAEEYAEEREKHCILGVYDDTSDLEYDKGYNEGYINGLKEGYIAGAKENGVVLHNIRENPNDLPKVSGRYLVYTGGEPFILDFATEFNSFGYWVVSLGDDWGVRDEDFETVNDRGEDDVIAWCELPKYTEE